MSLSRPHTVRESRFDRSNASGPATLRAAALGAALVLTASYVWVLVSVTDVVGGTGLLLSVVTAAALVGTVLARRCSVRTALAIGGVVATTGIVTYVLAVPEGVRFLTSISSLARDVLALLTGVSILRVVAAETWAIAFAPGPVFLSWYLVCRRRYAAGVAVGLCTLSVFVLTGDASLLMTTIGVVGGVAAVGFGELERRGAQVAQGDILVIALSLMLVSTLSITIVPGGASGPLSPAGQTQVLDNALVGSDEQVTIVGSMELSPEMRFVVESDEPAYWRTGAYDRYTGSTWVQSGEPDAYEGDTLDGPPGESRTITQTVRAETDLAVLPAAWQPVAVDGPATEGASVSAHGGFQPGDSIADGEEYVVESERPDPSASTLEAAGTDYPEGVEERYTQLPDSTPERVGEYTDALTADAENPYEQARIVEGHLGSQWEYSLDVERPEGDIADATLFEMDAAYCTYFATTMVAMLRSQEIPARLAVGYTEGEAIDEDQYAVRGLDAHAWVEVYFPETGWIEFDPTPAERDTVHENRLEDARDTGEPDVDTPASEPTEEDADEDVSDEPESETDESESEGETGESSDDESAPETGQPSPDRGGSSSPDGPIGDPDFETQRTDETERLPEFDTDDDEATGIGPSGELLAVLGALVAGLVAGVHRTGATGRFGSVLGRRSRENSPEAAAERAYERLETILEADYRARRPGESPRQYAEVLSLVGADERTRRITALYEKARYGPGVSEAEAEEALSLVARLNRDRPFRDRLRP